MEEEPGECPSFENMYILIYDANLLHFTRIFYKNYNIFSGFHLVFSAEGTDEVMKPSIQ